MNWEALGAIGEIVGAVAVVLTLGYLALQIRQNTLMMKATIRQQLTSASQEILYKIAENADIGAKLSSGVDLDPAETIRAGQLARAMFRGYENYVYQLQLGLFEASEWEGTRESLRAIFSIPWVQQEWSASRSYYSRSLREVVDQLLAEGR